MKLCALIAQSEFGDSPKMSDSDARAAAESRGRFEQLPSVLSLDDDEVLLSPTSGNASICVSVSSPTAAAGIDYAATSRVLLRELRDRLSGERLMEIAREHGALRGRFASSQEAKLAIIDMLRQWHLFGSVYFCVRVRSSLLQSTVTMPKVDDLNCMNCAGRFECSRRTAFCRATSYLA